MLGLNRNTLRKKIQELGVQSKRLSRRGVSVLLSAEDRANGDGGRQPGR
jgi:hypothetical protein